MQPRIVPVILNCNDEYWLPYCLEATRGFFNRYIIYDIGSTDASVDIIKWFMESFEDRTEFYARAFDSVLEPAIQGIFRNSMIAEARSEYYFILDSDEIYPPESFEALYETLPKLDEQYLDGKIYGVLPRIEVEGSLKSVYGKGKNIPHHRVYHRTAIWRGNHPGEIPFYQQRSKNEVWFDDALCYHFHNAIRSTKDDLVPKRLERKARGTYRPGEPEPFDLLEALPILKKPIAGFEPCPTLKILQDDQV